MRVLKISVFIIIALLGNGYVYAEQSSPAIHIESRIDNATLRTLLKNMWKLCVQEKEMLKTAKHSNNPVWPIMMEALKEERPDYDIDAGLYTPTDWSQFAVDSDREYFFNDKYAIYKKRITYTLSKDGQCRILSTTKKTATLDDGRFRYLVNITKGTAVKFQSGVVTIRENDKLLRSQENEATLLTVVDQLAVPTKKLPATIGSERVVGNYSCDYKVLFVGDQSKICYWDRMNYYPSVLNRPVILKSITVLGNEKNIKQAEVFEVTKEIVGSIFVPGPDIKVEDRTN